MEEDSSNYYRLNNVKSEDALEYANDFMPLTSGENKTSQIVSTSPEQYAKYYHNHNVSGSPETKSLVNADDKSPFPVLSTNNTQHLNSFEAAEAKNLHDSQKNVSEKKNFYSSSCTVSSNTDASVLKSETPPDGGYGWIVVMCAFVINLLVDGITFCFGILYVEFLGYFKESKSKTAWIGGIFMGVPLLCGPIASTLIDHVGCQKITIIGAILASFGFFISSYCNSVGQLILSFGVMAGFSLSLCDVAGVVIVAFYFEKKRSLATGLAVCGSGIGTFILAPFTQYLTKVYGWRGTMMILAGLVLNLCICGALMKDLDWCKRKYRKEKSMKIIRNSLCDSISSHHHSSNSNEPSVRKQEVNHSENIIDNRLYSSLLQLPTYLRKEGSMPSMGDQAIKEKDEESPCGTCETKFTNKESDEGSLHEIITAEEHPSEGLPFHKISHSIPVKCQESKKDLFLQKICGNISLKHIPAEQFNMVKTTRLQVSSCPDIYRHHHIGTTATSPSQNLNVLLDDFREALVEMLNFSYLFNLKYLLYIFSNLLLYAFYDVPYVYLTDYSISLGYREEMSSYLISVIGILNFFGEIILGYFGDRTWISPIVLYSVCMMLSGFFISLIPITNNYYLIATFAGGFGLVISANYSLTSAILVDLTSLEKFPTAYGLLLLVQGIGNLVGPSLVGWIIEIANFRIAFFISGSLIIVSGVMLLILPLARRLNNVDLELS